MRDRQGLWSPGRRIWEWNNDQNIFVSAVTANNRDLIQMQAIVATK